MVLPVSVRVLCTYKEFIFSFGVFVCFRFTFIYTHIAHTQSSFHFPWFIFSFTWISIPIVIQPQFVEIVLQFSTHKLKHFFSNDWFLSCASFQKIISLLVVMFPFSLSSCLLPVLQQSTFDFVTAKIDVCVCCVWLSTKRLFIKFVLYKIRARWMTLMTVRALY